MKRAHSWARCAAVMPATPLVEQCRRPARAEHHPGRVTAADPLQTAAPHRDSRRTMPVSTTAPLRSASRRPPRRSSAPGRHLTAAWVRYAAVARAVGCCYVEHLAVNTGPRSSRAYPWLAIHGRKLRSVQRQRSGRAVAAMAAASRSASALRSSIAATLIFRAAHFRAVRLRSVHRRHHLAARSTRGHDCCR